MDFSLCSVQSFSVFFQFSALLHGVSFGVPRSYWYMLFPSVLRGFAWAVPYVFRVFAWFFVAVSEFLFVISLPVVWVFLACIATISHGFSLHLARLVWLFLALSTFWHGVFHVFPCIIQVFAWFVLAFSTWLIVVAWCCLAFFAFENGVSLRFPRFCMVFPRVFRVFAWCSFAFSAFVHDVSFPFPRFWMVFCCVFRVLHGVLLRFPRFCMVFCCVFRGVAWCLLAFSTFLKWCFVAFSAFLHGVCLHFPRCWHGVALNFSRFLHGVSLNFPRFFMVGVLEICRALSRPAKNPFTAPLPPPRVPLAQDEMENERHTGENHPAPSALVFLQPPSIRLWSISLKYVKHAYLSCRKMVSKKSVAILAQGTLLPILSGGR